jgi:hypothetical protein
LLHVIKESRIKSQESGFFHPLAGERVDHPLYSGVVGVSQTERKKAI